MSSGIEKQDLLFSTKSTEWHGAANLVTSIGKKEIDLVSFNIIETGFGFNVDGIYVPMPNHKIIAADLRHRLDLDESDRIVPLHIPKTGYTAISNADVYQQALDICKGLSMDVVTMGTLEGCKKFFLSIDTGSSELTVKNRANGQNEQVMAYINLINSHDGTMAQETYDSMIRIVCMNTLRWSRQSKGDMGGKVYHTKNAKLAMEMLGKRINAILLGRVSYVETMEMLSEITISKENALYIALAYLGSRSEDGKKNKVSTRSVNAAESIQNLFERGKGNVGKSMYCLFNGFTEYYTSGDGVGKQSDAATKLYKGQFSGAADHKNDFLDFITTEDMGNEIETGKALHAQYLAGKL